MADITMKMGTYKVVSISVTTNAPDYLGQSSAARPFVIYKDGPLLGMFTYKVQALTLETTSPDVLGVSSSLREFIIYNDGPNLAMRMYKTSALTVTTENPDKLGVASALRYAFIITPPTVMASAARQVFIIEQAVTGPAAYTPQVFSQALQKADWPPVEGTFSTSSDIQVAQLAAVKNTDNAFKWSQTRVAEMPILTLMARPVTKPISYNMVARVAQQVLRASPIDTQSWKSVASIARLTLISLDRVPVPTSGSFVGEFTSMALVAKPMGGMPKSNTMDLQVVGLALQKRVDVFPRSKTTVLQNATLVLRPNTQPLARGPVMAAESFTLALQANPMPAMNDPSYHQPATVGQDFQLTLMKQALAFPWVGVEHSGQTAIKVLQKSIVEPVYGVQHDKLLTTLVLQSSPMQKPGSMSGANMPEIRTTVLLGRPYPSAAGIRSMTQANQAALEWLLRADYQKPGDVVAGTKFSYYRTLDILSVVSKREPLPLSKTRVPEMRLLTVMHADYDPPMKVFNDGLFVSLIGEQVMTVEEYPSTGEPVSQMTVTSLVEQLLETDLTFPDKGYSISDLQVSQLVEQLATEDTTFPDKDLAQSKLQVSQVVEQLVAGDNSFPDKDLVQSQLSVTQIAETVAVSADDYPPKGMVQSALVVTSLVENVVSRDTFPDKDVPQSTISVSQVAEVIMAVDDSMKGMPQYQGRRKPTIFVQIVY
ncbi:hypothetical protein JT354_gp49 [Serratia phage JS26]|uniref:Uncharacterized protein n=1 Tax=Serratia phage JS26 TaxID=2315217 RepID=A0A5Q2F1U4_9CAUD|nr:hypothetical protein JT354_gp49 [Serratia phage JS26]QGF20864.1 hypothetical protein [Serratia phage JS26]